MTKENYTLIEYAEEALRKWGQCNFSVARARTNLADRLRYPRPRLPIALLANVRDSLGRRDDPDALIYAAEGEQMLVAGDDQIRPAGERAGEHMIIVGIIVYYAGHLLGRCEIGQAPQIPDNALRCQASPRQARRAARSWRAA
jgi:hypothetical protein